MNAACIDWKVMDRTEALRIVRAYRRGGYTIRFEDDDCGGWYLGIGCGQREIARVVLLHSTQDSLEPFFKLEII